jgi:hypothetical protein
LVLQLCVVPRAALGQHVLARIPTDVDAANDIAEQFVDEHGWIPGMRAALAAMAPPPAWARALQPGGAAATAPPPAPEPAPAPPAKGKGKKGKGKRKAKAAAPDPALALGPLPQGSRVSFLAAAHDAAAMAAAMARPDVRFFDDDVTVFLPITRANMWSWGGLNNSAGYTLSYHDWLGGCTDPAFSAPPRPPLQSGLPLLVSPNEPQKYVYQFWYD